MFLKISIFKLIAEAARVSSVENIFTARPRAKFQPRASPREAGDETRDPRAARKCSLPERPARRAASSLRRIVPAGALPPTPRCGSPPPGLVRLA